MIEVRYWPRELRLTVQGHAKKETLEGNPLVCSAASILAYSLMNQMDAMTERKWAKCVYFHNGDGMAYMRAFKPRRLKFKALRVAFGMTFGGLAMLAEQYPDFVYVRVCTGEEFDDKTAIEKAISESEKTPL